ncbi:MAG: type II toxin-antitoxin system VapC family toxin [Acidobacteria bacterium]|nr:type II toxin-antitoxin system VapC family toxin [Acidobacteriota bacterium]
MKYVLDTNLYIRASREEEWNRQLISFYSVHAPFVHLHSVVAGELIAGAIRQGLQKKTHRHFLAPFEAVGRVITPSHAAWVHAGRIVATLIRRGALSPTGVKRSFLNDCLIAASCREHGFVLVTENLVDFGVISSVQSIRVVPPWPRD